MKGIAATFLLFLLLASTFCVQIEWGECPPPFSNNEKEFQSEAELLKHFASQKFPFPATTTINNYHLKKTLKETNRNNNGTTAPLAIKQCAFLQTPAFWDTTDPDKSRLKLNFHIRKISNAPAQRKGFVILINGGPGVNGGSMGFLGEYLFLAQMPDYDIFLPDHRGTGLSTKLVCPNMSQLERESPPGDLWRACAELTKNNATSPAFNPTEAARDLAAFIEAEKKSPEEKVFLYSMSYGTFLTHRFLQLFPNAVDGVVMDGVCPPQLCMMTTFDMVFDKVGQDLLTKCQLDPFCNDKMSSSSPQLQLQAMYELVDKRSPHCPALSYVNRKKMSSVLGMCITSNEYRSVALAIIYRYLRCTDKDVAALQKYFLKPDDEHDDDDDTVQLDVMAATAAVSSDKDNKVLSDLEFNLVLHMSIVVSEMYSNLTLPNYKIKQIIQDAENFTTFGRSTAPYYLAIKDIFPSYQQDRYYSKFAETSVPILMLNGDLDAQTPLYFAQFLMEKMKAPNVQLKVIPDAIHGTLFYLPCAQTMAIDFFKNPWSPVDGCKDVKRIDFSGKSNPGIAVSVFGTEDLYD